MYITKLNVCNIMLHNEFQIDRLAKLPRRTGSLLGGHACPAR